jgi:recombination protein RecT
MAGSDVAVRTVSERIASDEMALKLRSAVGNDALARRIQRAALTAIQTNPDLLEGRVTQSSVYTALLRCAQDGLLPDGREAALVRRKSEIVYQPMVGGFRKRAAESGFTLEAQIVYEGDVFEYELGLTPTLRHIPAIDRERGEPRAAYAIARHRDFEPFVEVMTKSEIEHVRKSSSYPNGGPWSKWWGEMARKTVARRLFKQLPLGADPSGRAASLLEADELAFGPFANLPTDVPVAPELEPASFEPTEYMDPDGVVDADDQSAFEIPEGARSE